MKKLLVTAMLLAPHSTLAGLIVSDATFNNADWTHSVNTSTGTNSFTTAQSLAGGNPGAFQSGNHILGNPGDPGPNFIRVVHLFVAGGSYDPGVVGPIASIDFQYDFLVSSVFNAGPDVGHGLLLEQNGYFYHRRNPNASGNVWTSFSASGLVSSDFGLLTAGGPALPDFGVSGAPIRFGYSSLNGYPAGGTGQSRLFWGIDNYSVAVNSVSVPEPGTLGLLGAGLLGLAVRRKKAA